MTSSLSNSDLQKLIELNKRVKPENENAQQLSSADVQKLIELNKRFSEDEKVASTEKLSADRVKKLN